MIHAKHLLNEHGQLGDAKPAKLFQFVNGARTAHEHIFGAERKFGRGQRQIAYDLCNALDLAAAMKVRPGETVEQLVAMKELHMRQVIAMSGAAQMHQRHQRHIAHLMLHQSHIELMRLLALVGLDAEHIVGPSMLYNGQQRLQLCANIGAECCGLFAGLSTRIALREEALHQRQFTLMKRCAYILRQHVGILLQKSMYRIVNNVGKVTDSAKRVQVRHIFRRFSSAAQQETDSLKAHGIAAGCHEIGMTSTALLDAQ